MVPGVDDRLDEYSVACELIGVAGERCHTSWRGIRRLAAAHHASSGPDDTHCQPQRYWQLPLDRPRLVGRGRDLCAELGNRLDHAISRRAALASGSCGSLLSGGLDSSAITCGISAQHSKLVHAFSFVIDEAGSPGDELMWQQRVVANRNILHHRLPVLAHDPTQRLAELRNGCGSLAWGPIAAIRAAAATAIANSGCRVLFDGYEGDATIGYGYGRLVDGLRHGRWAWAVAESRRLAQRDGRPWWRSMASLVRPLAPGWLRSLERRWRHGRGGPWPWSLINPAFAERINLSERVSQLWSAPRSPLTYGERREHWSVLSGGALQTGLEAIDAINARSGVEGRFPFFDRDLIEWCLGLPDQLRLHHGWTRLALRQALSGRVPATIRARSDKGQLGRPFTAAITAHVQHHGLADTPPDCLGDWVCPQRWRHMARRLRSGEGDYLDALDLWLAYGLMQSYPSR
jgi:asparagine synthase (glutamine-hydrolysing)